MSARTSPLQPQEDVDHGIGPSSALINPSSVPSSDSSDTADGLRDDKPDDKKSPQHQTLLAVIEAWPELPDEVKAGILAMVQAFTGKGGAMIHTPRTRHPQRSGRLMPVPGLAASERYLPERWNPQSTSAIIQGHMFKKMVVVVSGDFG